MAKNIPVWCPQGGNKMTLMRKTVWNKGGDKKRRKHKRMVCKKLNSHGSSLIMVIVGAAFLGVLGALILSITCTNIDLKTIDQLSKRNFYLEEVAVNEITARLEEYSAESMSSAYTWLVQNYKKESRNMDDYYEEFKKAYMIALSQALNGTGTVMSDVSDTYNAELLQTSISANLDKEESGRDVETSVYLPDGIGSTRIGTIEHSKDPEGNYTYEYLTLKNLSITYTDNGYQTNIVTDICMELPIANGIDTSFAKYALISDQLIDCSGNVSVTGGVYAGKLETPDTNHGGDPVNPNTGGIWVHSSDGQLHINGNGNLVATRANITSSDYARLHIENAAVWATNIMTIGAGDEVNHTPSINIKAITKVADDLILKANHSNVTLSDDYYGFSYKSRNEENKTSSSTSSAITVNAKNVSLDLSALNTLVLFGRAFVSTKENGMNDVSSSVWDIMTGQSIAVKYDQGAYLVPNDTYLKIPSNPIDSQSINEYAESLYQGTSEYDPVAPYLSLNMEHDIVDFDKGNAKTIRNYLDATTPIRAVYYKQGTGDRAVYMVNYYFNFKNETAANAYFQTYYGANQTELQDTYKQFYGLEGGTYQFKLNPNPVTRFQLAGDVLYQNAAGEFQVKTGDLSGIESESQIHEEDYKSVQLNLRTNGDTTKEVDANEYVDTHFNLGAVRANSTSSITTTLRSSTLNREASVYISNADTFIVDDSMAGLVIASGNVEVQAVQFEGLIVADGKIVMQGHSSIIADEKLVGALLKYCRSNGNLLKDYIYGMGSVDGTTLVDERIQYGNAISFENWKKNVS